MERRRRQLALMFTILWLGLGILLVAHVLRSQGLPIWGSLKILSVMLLTLYLLLKGLIYLSRKVSEIGKNNTLIVPYSSSPEYIDYNVMPPTQILLATDIEEVHYDEVL